MRRASCPVQLATQASKDRVAETPSLGNQLAGMQTPGSISQSKGGPRMNRQNQNPFSPVETQKVKK